MVLKLSGHVRNTISLLYMQNTRWNSDIWNFFSEKMDSLSILVYVHLRSAFWVRPCLKTSLWRYTLTDFHDFGINGKRRPYSIPWYQTIILWARQFQVHKGVVTTRLSKPCYKKRLGRTRVELKELKEILGKDLWCNKWTCNFEKFKVILVIHQNMNILDSGPWHSSYSNKKFGDHLLGWK